MDSKIIGAILVFTILGAGAGFFVSKTLYDPQFLEFESVIDDLDTQISLISQILAQTEEENTDLELSLDEVEGNYDDLNEDYASLSTNLDLLLTQMESLTDDYGSLNETYYSLSESNSLLLVQHEDLSSQYADLETEYHEILSEYERVVGALPVEALTTSLETYDKTYPWEYQGQQYSLQLSIPESHYLYYQGLDRIPTDDWSIYVTHPYDDNYVDVIIRKFNNIAIEEGLTEIQKVNLVISFVQSLPYTSDDVTTGFDEYPRFPLETLVDDGGDCEDSAILTAALIDALNYPVVLLGLPGHMAVGIAIPATGIYYELDGEEYFYLETTGEGWLLGELPDDYLGEAAYLYEMENTAIITHDWSAEWVSTSGEYSLEVVMTIQNAGTLAAYGLQAYVAYDAGDDYVWYPIESDPFDLNFGRETTITLILSPLDDEYTRLIVGVLDAEGYLIDVSYSEWFDTT